MAVEITEFDPAAYLDDDAAIAAYLTDALETQDVAFISDAIGVIARAKGMKQIAQDAGVSRESLYRALSSAGNPELGTVIKVLASIDIKLTAQPKLAWRSVASLPRHPVLRAMATPQPPQQRTAAPMVAKRPPKHL
jgi:probable addiction module antidote protein